MFLIVPTFIAAWSAEHLKISQNEYLQDSLKNWNYYIVSPLII